MRRIVARRALTLLASLLVTQAAQASKQEVTPDPPLQAALADRPISVGVSYATANPCTESLTGLGLRVHWDSSKLALEDPGSVPNEASLSPFAIGTGQDGLVRVPGWSVGAGALTGNASAAAHPAWCDVDGDGAPELVLGYDQGGAGRLDVYDDRANAHAWLATLQGDWGSYNRRNGATWPACADLDGDGRDELVIGHGKGSAGWVLLLDDAANGYAPLPQGINGWLQVAWTGYQRADGTVHPAAGNLDADSAPELLLGLGDAGAGWAEVRDDLSAGLGNRGWIQHGDGGATWPALCDSDGVAGTARSILLGPGRGNLGTIARYVLDPDLGLQPAPEGDLDLSGQLGPNLGRALIPACGNLDADSADELVIGLGPDPAAAGTQTLLLRDDAGNADGALGRLLQQTPADGAAWPALGPATVEPVSLP
jgi:hypothetical protein